jgi:hypothetical protein
MRTIALLLLSCTFTTWAADSMIDRRLRDAITAMASNQVPGAPSPLERGARLLLAEGAQEDQVQPVMKRFEEAFAKVGAPQLVEEVATRLYGSRSEVAYYVLPCQRGAVFLRLVSVKRADNQRVVGELAVATSPEAIFPPGLLEPDPNTPVKR